MLEQQQHQLVAGLRKLYSMAQNGESWPGGPLATAQSGYPLTHDILERLDVLHIPSENGQQHYEGFEEDCNRMQQKLLRKGTKPTNRRGSTSSNSDHSHTSSPSSISEAPMPRALKCVPSGPFALHNAPPTPPALSPFPSQVHIVTTTKIEPPLSPEFMNSALDASALRSSWAGEPMLVDDLDPRFMNSFGAYSYQANILSGDPMNSAGPMLPNWNEPNFDELTNFMDHTVNT